MHVEYVFRGNVKLIVTVCLPTLITNFWKSSAFIHPEIASSWAFVDSPSAQIDRFIECYIVILKGLINAKITQSLLQ